MAPEDNILDFIRMMVNQVATAEIQRQSRAGRLVAWQKAQDMAVIRFQEELLFLAHDAAATGNKEWGELWHRIADFLPALCRYGQGH